MISLHNHIIILILEFSLIHQNWVPIRLNWSTFLLMVGRLLPDSMTVLHAVTVQLTRHMFFWAILFISSFFWLNHMLKVQIIHLIQLLTLSKGFKHSIGQSLANKYTCRHSSYYVNAKHLSCKMNSPLLLRKSVYDFSKLSICKLSFMQADSNERIECWLTESISMWSTQKIE